MWVRAVTSEGWLNVTITRHRSVSLGNFLHNVGRWTCRATFCHMAVRCVRFKYRYRHTGNPYAYASSATESSRKGSFRTIVDKLKNPEENIEGPEPGRVQSTQHDNVFHTPRHITNRMWHGWLVLCLLERILNGHPHPGTDSFAFFNERSTVRTHLIVCDALDKAHHASLTAPLKTLNSSSPNSQQDRGECLELLVSRLPRLRDRTPHYHKVRRFVPTFWGRCTRRIFCRTERLKL